MQKIISPGCRTAEFSLDGSECEIIFSERYNVFSVQSESEILISLEKNKISGDDGTLTCKAGESVMYPHMARLNRFYITGSGKVRIFASNEAVNPFKNASKGGGGNSNGTFKIFEFTPSSGEDRDYNAFVKWFDDNVKPFAKKICDIEYASPYNDGGYWLIWRPKLSHLKNYFAGVQYYPNVNGQWINLQTYYGNNGEHIGVSTAGQELSIIITDDMIIYGHKNSTGITVYYVYSISGTVMSYGHYLT